MRLVRLCAGLLLAVALAACGGPPSPAGPAPVIGEAPAEVRALEAAIVAHVRDQLGAPYRLGGQGQSGFDCSGLIQSAYAAQGIALPRVSRDQARAGRAVPQHVRMLRPGDILAFAGDGRTVSHVGLYIGDGRFIHSASRGVRESLLDASDPDGRWYLRRWVGVRRILPTWPGDPAAPTD